MISNLLGILTMVMILPILFTTKWQATTTVLLYLSIYVHSCLLGIIPTYGPSQLCSIVRTIRMIIMIHTFGGWRISPIRKLVSFMSQQSELHGELVGWLKFILKDPQTMRDGLVLRPQVRNFQRD